MSMGLLGPERLDCELVDGEAAVCLELPLSSRAEAEGVGVGVLEWFDSGVSGPGVRVPRICVSRPGDAGGPGRSGSSGLAG